MADEHPIFKTLEDVERVFAQALSGPRADLMAEIDPEVEARRRAAFKARMLNRLPEWADRLEEGRSESISEEFADG